ncbi:tetratricopeptide repeat protein [Neptunicella sp. SCSIO 80796]|uniref:tetratricopeptide repeat protein n=1 Tax=Neptunicella plasticusilytica TaxID=3117012 RepID=UPI003A4DF764
MKNRRLKLLTLMLAMVLPLKWVQAQSYIPQNGDELVASWPVADKGIKQTTDLAYIAQLIDQGQYPGQSSQSYGRAKALLKPFIEQTQFNPQAWYLWARVLQHQHHFEQAQQALQRILNDDPTNINSWLLKANIHLVSNQPQQAKQACLQLLGKADMLTVSTCALEASSYQDKLLSSYQQLLAIKQQTNFDDLSTQLWVTQILADMAVRLNKLAEAAVLLDNQDLQKLPLSYLVQWADVQLSLNHHRQVLEQLGKVVQKNSFMDDALLLRLAIAEKRESSGQDTTWSSRFSRRVTLRELRQDESHAADLARFYMDVTPNPQKAQYWAKMNWRDAKLVADKKLLERARLPETYHTVE